MGVWGYGPFDNDSAADLLAYVQEAGAGGWQLVMKALRGHYDHDIAAAAEIVATALGAPTYKDQRTLAFAVGRHSAGPWARRYASSMPAQAPALALSQMKRVASRTHQLGWTKPGAERAWKGTCESLIRRLSRGRTPSRSSSPPSSPSRNRTRRSRSAPTRRSRRGRRRTS